VSVVRAVVVVQDVSEELEQGRPVERGLSAVWDLPVEVRLWLRQGPTDDQIRLGGSAAGRESRPEEGEGDLASRPVRAPAGWWQLDGVGAPGRW